MKKLILLLLLICYLNNSNAQQKELDSLLNELKKHPQEDTTRLNLLCDIVFDYADIDPSKGIFLSNEALILANKLKNYKLTLAAYNAKASCFLGLPQYDSAFNIFYFELKIAETKHDSSFIAKILSNLAATYYQVGKFNEGLQAAQKSLTIINSSNDYGLKAKCYNNLGLNYLGISDYLNAVKWFQATRIAAEKAHDEKVVAAAYANLMEIYNGINDFPNALNNALKALPLAQKIGDNYITLLVTESIGQIYYFLNNLPKAFEYYNEALKLPYLNDFENAEAIIYSGFGLVNGKAGNYKTALNYLQQADTILNKIGDKLNESVALNEIGNIYYKVSPDSLKQQGINTKNNLAVALSYQKQALKVAEEIGSKQRELIIWQDISNIYAKQKDFENGFYALQKSIAYKDSIVNDSTKQQVIRLEMQYQFSKTQDSTKAITDKQQALAKAEIQKQHIIQNSIMAGAGFLILAGIGGFVFYKRNKDIKIQRNEAELKSQITDTEMKALRAQMNPHFIFNSLNSIADYIDKHQTKAASDFTTKFAKLMRMVLENSEHKEIPLADDLKALELYMQLERFRLNNKFDYTIKVDEDIDAENTLVPPLILQPFIENSIWHGIVKKAGNGNITIVIKKENEMICCIVEDDGIGISETKIVDNESKSLGMRITKDRIDVLNKLKNSNASVHVFNKEKGVIAEVKLPLELSF